MYSHCQCLAFDQAFIELTNSQAVRGITWNGTASFVLVFTLSALAAAFVWSKQLRLPPIDSLHFLLGPTSPSAFWRRADVGRSLRSATPGVRAPDTGVPADYVRAIQELQRVSGADRVQEFQSAIAVVQRVPAALAAIDREIAAFDGDASPVEIARLNARLSALQQTTPSGTHSEQHRSLVAIVQSELALLETIQQRKILAQSESDVLLHVMKSLWSELARTPGPTPEHAEQSVRVAKLVERGTELLERRANEQRANEQRENEPRLNRQRAE